MGQLSTRGEQSVKMVERAKLGILHRFEHIKRKKKEEFESIYEIKQQKVS
jgi:hypothetical protein